MDPYFSNLLMADRQRELRRQADNWRLYRGPRIRRARRIRRWQLQSPIVRRAAVTPCP